MTRSSQSGTHPAVRVGESSPALAPTDPSLPADRDVHVSTLRPVPRLAKCGLVSAEHPSTGNELKALRIAAGLSMAQLAERLGVTERTLRRWEHDDLADVDRAEAMRLLRDGLVSSRRVG